MASQNSGLDEGENSKIRRRERLLSFSEISKQCFGSEQLKHFHEWKFTHDHRFCIALERPQTARVTIPWGYGNGNASACLSSYDCALRGGIALARAKQYTSRVKCQEKVITPCSSIMCTRHGRDNQFGSEGQQFCRPKRPLASGPPTTERSNGRGAHLAVPTFGSLMEYGANRRPTKNNGRRQTQRGRGKEEDLANGASMVTEGYCFFANSQ